MLVCFLSKRTSGHLNSKGFLRMFLMTLATQKEQATTRLKTNSMNVNHVEYKKGFNLRTICDGICHKSQQVQLVEIRKMVSVDPAWNILTCASQNMDEEMLEMPKLVAVKIISNFFTANEEAVLKSILLVALDNGSTLLFILDNSGLKIGNCCWLVL